jgi:hypothetical protein
VTLVDLEKRGTKAGRAVRAAAVAAAVFLPSCEYVNPATPPPEPGSGALEIVVSPDPLRLLWACPTGQAYCYGSLDSILTLSETAGVGVRLDKLDMVARESLTSATVGELHFTGTEIAARAGTNRIEAGKSLAVRPVVEGWPYPANLPRPKLNVDITAEGTDDRGNAVRQTKRVPVS